MEKVGRNDPCPCGSGKKYKQCCALANASNKAAQAVAPPGERPQTNALTALESNQLVSFFNAGRFADMESAARALLARLPQSAFAWKALGTALLEQGKDALQALQQAAHLMPNDAETLNNLGNVLQNHGRSREAFDCYQSALRLIPDFAEAMCGLGLVLTSLRQLDAAITSCKRAIGLKPAYAMAYNNLGNALRDRGQLQDALQSYRRALHIKPDVVDWHSNMALALMESGKHHEAINQYQRALELDPDHARSCNGIGDVHYQMGHFDDAIACYQRTLKIDPNLDVTYSGLLFAMSNGERTDAKTLFAKHREFAEYFEAPLRANWPQHDNVRDPERQLRIGFVSGDLRNHAVAMFMVPIFAELIKSELLSLHIYHNHAVDDSVTQHVRNLVPQWNTIAGTTDGELAQKIRADGIDILIDLSGHTALNRLLTFARKPAPLQASWIGYPGTTGLQAMDYYIADRFFLPTEQFAEQFTEKIVHLPVNAPFLPNENAPEINALPMLSKGYVTFGSFNRTTKINPSVVAVWAQLLHALPDSRLLLGAASKENCRDLFSWFELEGITLDRIDVHPRSSMESYLKLYHEVDLCLDTFPYNGGSTTWQALWMGVPTLTLAGDTPSGRQGAAILGQVGLDTFVARNKQEFVEKGIAWAKQADSLAEIRAQSRERFAQSPAGRPSVVAQGLEQALRTMWRRWCEGLPAAHVSVE